MPALRTEREDRRRGKIRYPDALVTCSPVDFRATVVAELVVVFEVVSEDSARTDRIDKVRDYQATPLPDNESCLNSSGPALVRV
jgi:Uma2 family endonuclease